MSSGITVITLYIKTPELSHLRAVCLYPLTNISLFSLYSAPENHHSALYFYENMSFCFYRYYILHVNEKIQFCFACWRSHSLSVLQARAGVHIKMGMSILHWFLEAVLMNTSVRVHLLPWVLHHCQFKVKFVAAHLILAQHI